MVAGPALWPEAFVAEHELSGWWLGLLGALQAAGGAGLLGLAGVRWIQDQITGEAFDLSLHLPDVPWTTPVSFYSHLDEDE